MCTIKMFFTIRITYKHNFRIKNKLKSSHNSVNIKFFVNTQQYVLQMTHNFTRLRLIEVV